jgi:hypothetical protein
MNSIRLVPTTVLLAPLTVCLLGCASAGDAPTVTPRLIDARADEQLQRMSTSLAALPAFSFDAEVRYDDYLIDTQKIQLGRRVSMNVQRPNRVRAIVEGDIRRLRYGFDGTRAVVLDEDRNQYSEAPAPETIDAALTDMAERHGFVLPLAELIASDPYAWMMGSVESATYVGVHPIDGRPCHHLAFEQPTLDWQIWIDTADIAVPRRLLISYKQMPNCPQYEVAFRHWTTAATFGDADFAIAIPADAARVELEPTGQVVGTKATR